MAMKKKVPASQDETKKAAAAAPKKEAPVETAGQDAAADAAAAEEKVGADVPAVKAAAGAPTRPGRVDMKDLVLAELQDLMIMPYGTMPRIKTTNGNFMDGDDNALGDTIEGQVMSWNELYIVGPCDNKAPNDLVKYSYDNVNLEDGSGTVQDYVAEMKGADYADASSKKYYEVIMSLNKSAKPSDHIGELVQLQLSPTSVSEFSAYQVQTTFKIAKGMLKPGDADMVQVTAKPASSKGNNWTKATFKNLPQG